MPAIVAVPVKNEAARIANCVQAIVAQQECRPAAVVLLINNTTDDTADICRTLRSNSDVPIDVIEHELPPEQAGAGAARRMAMECAANRLGESGVLLTTDADGRVPNDWVAANLYHIRNGLDAVAGCAVLDSADAAQIPSELHDNDALEVAYGRLLDAIAARIDPEPWDPWPRHTEHSGASIAVTLDAYRQVGGMPAAPLAEDRRFFAALRKIDARIRHAPEIKVVVSGRTVGRAEGGMADTIRRRLTAPDPYLDDALEPATIALRRVRTRALFRRARSASGVERERLTAALATDLKVEAMLLARALAERHAGAGFGLLEGSSRKLPRRLVAARDVGCETAMAEAILRELSAETVLVT